MKKMLRFAVLFAVVFAFVFTGCKKYEDGPGFSLSSKKARVANVWKVESVLDAGTALPNDPEWANESYEFTKDGKYIETDVNGDVYEATWAFDSENENIILTESGYSTTFKIKRLTQKEMWLELVDFEMEIHYAAK